MDIKSLLQGMDQKELMARMKRIEQMLNTPEGLKIKNRLMRMNKDELLSNLQKFEATNDIKGDILSELDRNPDIIKKIGEFLDADQ